MGFFGAVGNWIDTHIIQGVKNFGRFLVGLLKSFWTSFHEKIKNIITKVETKINRTVLGVLTLLRRGVDGAITKVSRNVTKVNNMYEQIDVESRPISPDEVPEEFKNALQNKIELDISDKYLNVLTA